MKQYDEVTLDQLQGDYEDMCYPFICDGDYMGVYSDVSEEYKPKNDTQKCKHEWEYYYPHGEEHRRCAKCGVIAE